MAVGVLFAFAVTVLINVLVSSGITVPLTNSDIANSHPGYIVPSGYTFSIWAVIYFLVAVFSVLQLLPAQRHDPVFRAARPWALASYLFNCVWLYAFSYELYWMSGIVIAMYAGSVLKLIELFNLNYLQAHQSWKHKLSCCAFSSNAAWVCVATGVQVSINLTNEGWMPSPDFTCGLLFVITLLAAYNVFRRCDFTYATVSAWALGGIINNQGKTSNWGTYKNICSKACKDIMSICEKDSGNMWAEICHGKAPPPLTQIVDKSEKVIVFCYVCIALVLVALIAGVINGIRLRRDSPGIDATRLSSNEHTLDELEPSAEAL